MNVVRTLELCAGVGMLGEGLHAGIRHLGGVARSVGYVERDAYAAALLLERMEEQALEPAPVWAGNLQDVRWEQWHGSVDCVLAGFPCQPHSMAGSRKGTDDDRWIWPAIADCIRRIEPGFVFLENVSGLRSSGGFAPVLADLAALGFRVEWDSLRASDVGASHQRERVFILGVADSKQSPSIKRHRSDVQRRWQEEAKQAGVGGGELRSSLGHSRLQHQHQEQRAYGAEYQGAGGVVFSGVDLADTGKPGPERRERRRAHAKRNWSPASGSAPKFCEVPVFAPGPSSPAWLGIVRDNRHLSPSLESGVRVLADGVAVVLDESRQDQLRCIGNGVVATCSAVAFVTLARRAGIA